MRKMIRGKVGPAILVAVLFALLLPLVAAAQATHDCTIVSDSEGVVSMTCVRKPTPPPILPTVTPSVAPTETPTDVPTVVPTVPPTATPTSTPVLATATAPATVAPTVTKTPVPATPTATKTPVPPTVVPTATTAPSTPGATGDGIWISQAEIMALPTSGPGWDEVKSAAAGTSGSPSLSNQDSNHSTGIMAAALVYARTGDTVYRDKVLAAIRSLTSSDYTSGGRALAFGREMIGYVLSADIINLKVLDPTLDAKFRAEIKRWLDAPASSGPDSLRVCSDDRPNNWGTHCTASRIAIDLYLGDKVDLDKAANVVRGWMGDRSAYSGFNYGELWWQADPANPVGVNPKGSMIQGHDVGGLQPEEMRRGGAFAWPPPATDYAWEGNQGALASTWMLMRAGYPADQWEDRAECRVAEALYRIGWAAEGDDQWQPWLINKICGTNYATTGGGRGKNVGWTRWTFSNN